MGRATDMMRQIKEQSITRSQAAQLGEEELKDKIVRGVFADRDIPEYTELYDRVIALAQAKVAEGTRSEGEALPHDTEAVGAEVRARLREAG